MIEDYKARTLNNLLEWCVLDKNSINEQDELFLNDMTLTAVDNVLGYLEDPNPEKLQYIKSYIVAVICAAYNVGHSKIKETKKRTDNVNGDEWKEEKGE